MSKRQSPMKQKLLYQVKQTYTPQQKLNFVPCSCDPKTRVPGWILDKIADEKLTAGYNVKRSNQCNKCFQLKSSNGSCGC